MFAFNSVSHYKYVPLFPGLKKNLLQKRRSMYADRFPLRPLSNPSCDKLTKIWGKEVSRASHQLFSRSTNCALLHFTFITVWNASPHTHGLCNGNISINICEMIISMALNELLEWLIRCLINLKQVQSQANWDLGIFGWSGDGVIRFGRNIHLIRNSCWED